MGHFHKLLCHQQCWRSALFFRADRGSGSFENKGGSRIADLAPSNIRRILQIRLPNADPSYIINIESIFQGGMKV